ncbi:MAG: hypothetical protein IJ694_07510 [Acidaminococcaceae bacterium]|nr:hypothetical protein [Acidaminococcaceae bacterium]
MKQFFFTLLFCSILSQCFALVPMTDENINKAIQYGVAGKQDNQAMPDFLNPWKMAERTLKNPYREKETIVLYTPFLLTAIHARDKVEESRVPELTDIRAAVKEYEGITLIGARINAPVVLKEGEYTAKLVQGKTEVAPYAHNFLSWEMLDAVDREAPVEMKPTGDIMRPEKAGPPKMRKIAVLDYQFYFDSSQFDPNQRFAILISDKYCGERRFEVDPASIR